MSLIGTARHAPGEIALLALLLTGCQPNPAAAWFLLLPVPMLVSLMGGVLGLVVGYYLGRAAKFDHHEFDRGHRHGFIEAKVEEYQAYRALTRHSCDDHEPGKGGAK